MLKFKYYKKYGQLVISTDAKWFYCLKLADTLDRQNNIEVIEVKKSPLAKVTLITMNCDETSVPCIEELVKIALV